MSERKPNYDKNPVIRVGSNPGECVAGWPAVLAELRRRIGGRMLIAGGEMTRELYEFEQLLRHDCLDVYQPDAVCTMGISGLAPLARRIAAEGKVFRDLPGQPSERSNCGEEITEAEYEKMFAKIDFSVPMVDTYADGDLFDDCAGGACPVR